MTLSDGSASLRAALRDVSPVNGKDGEWIAVCPCHEDTKPSLSIRETQDKILVVCRACGAKGIQVCEAVGLKANVLFDDTGPSKDKVKDSLEATYVYRDEAGQPYTRVLKYRKADGGKRFIQQRREGDRWISGLSGRTPLPYNLPEVLEADVIWVVEGEKDCETLSKHDHVATTNPMGAGKWPESFAPYLAGRHVAVVPDADEAGERHIIGVVNSILPVAASVRVVRLPGATEKDDVTDWLAAGHSIEELEQLAGDAVAVTKPLEQVAGEDDKRIMQIVYVGTRIPTPPEFLIAGLLVRDTCVLIGGAPKAQKSFFADDVAIAGASGGMVLGKWEAKSRFRTLCYSPEGGIASLERRLWGLCKGRGLDPAVTLANIPIIGERVNISEAENYYRLRETIDSVEPDLLLLDPLACVHRANENHQDEIQPVLDDIRDLYPGLTVLIVHHTSKAEGRSLGYSLRGSTALEAWRDTLISVRPAGDDDDAPRRVDISHRDCASPGAAGFEFTWGPLPEQEAIDGVYSYRLSPCDAPEIGKRKSGSGRPADMTTLTRLTKLICQSPHKYTRNGAADVLGFDDNEKKKIYRQIAKHSVDGKAIKLDQNGLLYTENLTD